MAPQMSCLTKFFVAFCAFVCFLICVSEKYSDSALLFEILQLTHFLFLNLHLTNHFVKKVLKCSECKKIFSPAPYLRNHMMALILLF